MKSFIWLSIVFLSFEVCQAEMVTVSVDTATLRDKPSLIGCCGVLEVPLFYPLLVNSERNGFYEVSDFEGKKGWIHKALVKHEKAVVVDVNKINVRSGPGTTHPILFKAFKGVAFTIKGEKDGWLFVKHESGKSGWLSKALTWGFH